MKVIKNINNNVSLCLDSKGKQVVAFGKGIGFVKAEHEVPLSQIDRTFYELDDLNLSSLQNVSAKSISLAIAIIDEASDVLKVEYPSSAYLMMADHIDFMLERRQNNIYLDMPIIEDIKHLYPEEMQLAYETLKRIEESEKVHLPRNEAGILALHFINDRAHEPQDKVNTSLIADHTLQIIEECLNCKICMESFSCSRYKTHLDYLIRRCFKNEQLNTTNIEMYEELIRQYPETYECVNKIACYFDESLSITLTEEEKMYLVLHINRLISREE